MKQILDEILDSIRGKDTWGISDGIDNLPLVNEEKYCKELGQPSDKNKIYMYYNEK